MPGNGSIGPSMGNRLDGGVPTIFAVLAFEELRPKSAGANRYQAVLYGLKHRLRLLDERFCNEEANAENARLCAARYGVRY